AMPPKLVSDDGRNVVIRPLAYCFEDDLAAWADLQQFPIIPCDLCGSQPNLQRQQVKQMLREWDKRFPGRTKSMFNALSRITPSHLMDPTLFDFKGLIASGVPDPDGDRAFDPESFASPDVIPLLPAEE
ncbi:MAG: tRNA 2-thiocytidine(32) synthetase TtcA, partial [Georgfuchsia sp.]